jgi:nitroreductase
MSRLRGDPESEPAQLERLLRERFGHEVAVPAALAGHPGIAELVRMARQAVHRAWSDDPVPAELVSMLAACALSAPTKSYLQQVDIVDVRAPARRAALCALVPSMPWMKQAPAILVFCANGRRFRRLFERKARAFTNDHLDAFFNPVVDASLVMMNFINAAGAIGLTSCPISMIRNAPDRLAEVLELPERIIPVAGLCVGYPVQERSVSPRIALDAVFHVDRINAVNEDAAIDDFDRRYVETRKAVLPPSAPSPRPWSDERVDQYAEPQRADWGRFVRAMKFDVDK